MNKTQAATLTLATIPVFLAGNLLAPREYVTDIVSEQASKGEYVQILEGNKLPDDAKGALSTRLPDNVSINTHSGPEGDGYSIVTKEKDQTISIGIGAYAEEYTWVKKNEASSTEPIKK